MSAPAVSGFDIVPFALPNRPTDEVRFEEPREIERIVVTFDGPPGDGVGVQYLRKTWPQHRIEQIGDLDLKRSCTFGWMRMDDGFNAKWIDARCIAQVRGRRVTLTFAPLQDEMKGDPVADGYDVTFRRTLGIRITGGAAKVTSIAAFTRSRPARTLLRVELDAGRRTPGTTLELEGYSALIAQVAPLSGVTVRVSSVRLGPAKRRALSLDVRHMTPSHRYSGDEGLVTFRLKGRTFTVSLASLAGQGPVWFAEAGVYIADAGDSTAFADYRARNAGCRTIAQQVAVRGEQSLAGAINGQPRPHPVPFVVGCKHARQKFWIEPNGDVETNAWLVTTQPAGDTPRWKNHRNGRLLLGLERWSIDSRFNDPWPAPAYNLLARNGDLDARYKCFAVPLSRSIAEGEGPADETLVAMVRLEFRNTGDAPVACMLPVGYTSDAWRAQNRRIVGIWASHNSQDEHNIPRAPREKLRLDGRCVRGEFKGQDVLRFAFATDMSATQSGDGVAFSATLAPGQACRVVLMMPYVALETLAEQSVLAALDFGHCYDELRRYWRAEVRRGASIVTPEPALNGVYTGHLPMVLLSDFGSPDGDGLVNTSVGAAVYGNFTNEACMILEELDQRGLADEVRRRLGIWVKHQGTAGLRGNFTDHDGVFFGTGGLQSGDSYCQHHGWALWYLCRHFLLTGDREWFAGVLNAVLKGLEWIFRQRAQTAKPLPHSRGWERGFFPAGALEDVDDYFYWLSTNSLTWRGVAVAAAALEAFGHPQAARVRREADAFARDLRRGFDTARDHSPLVRLRNGRWVPHYPSRLYRRGRDLGWIRETLEGSVYLLLSGLYDPRSREAQWILDDYLDTRYMNPPFGYALGDEPIEWFDCGGFSVQPNLLAGLLPHLDRDEIEVYLWMFFNAWAACYRTEVTAMVEHPMPVLGFSNSAPQKTSDQSNAVKWLAYMFVYERGELLHLGRAVPRDWLADARGVWARGIATTFGRVGIRYTSDAAARTIVAEAELDLRRAPGRLLVRFRHPRREPILAVTVNGKDHAAFAPAGDVDLTGLSGTLRIEARY